MIVTVKNSLQEKKSSPKQVIRSHLKMISVVPMKLDAVYFTKTSSRAAVWFHLHNCNILWYLTCYIGKPGPCWDQKTGNCEEVIACSVLLSTIMAEACDSLTVLLSLRSIEGFLEFISENIIINNKFFSKCSVFSPFLVLSEIQ